MKTTHLEEKRTALVEKREKLIGRFNQAARDRKSTARVCSEIRRTNEFLESLERIAAENTGSPNTGPRRYAVSSLFLHESFKKLTADQDEQFFFVTGAEVDGVHGARPVGRVRPPDAAAAWAWWLTCPRRTTCSSGSNSSATSSWPTSTATPATGPDATHPSGTDENFQKRLESAGHLALMAIFSRDGFVRFVRLDQNFEIEIYGEGVENHAPGIYRLTNID